jgi:cytochrome P450
VWHVTDAAELISLDEDAYYQDPMGLFARLRASRPVAPAQMPDFGRVWIITRYADVRAALTDPRVTNKPRRGPAGGPSAPDECRSRFLRRNSAGVPSALSTAWSPCPSASPHRGSGPILLGT